MIERSYSHRRRVQANLVELQNIQTRACLADALVSARAMAEAGLMYLKRMYGDEIEDQVIDVLDSSDVLDRPLIFVLGRTCEYWSARFTKVGLPISAEEIEERALVVGKFYQVGRNMLLRPDQLSAIFETDRPEDRARKAAIPKPRKTWRGMRSKILKQERKK